jgi:uncharacterized protein YggE
MRLSILAPALGLAALFAGPALAQTSPDDTRAIPAIVVTGEGVATVTPDIAIVTSGVVTRAETAGEALSANSAAMDKVLATLKAAKVADRDMGTSGLSVQPQYDYGDGSSGSKAPKLVGYEVRNTVTIRARDLDGLGALLDKLVAAGSNQIEGLVFDVADRSKSLNEARRSAVADAREKAELFAEAAKAKLGAVIGIEDQEISDAPVRQFTARAKAMDAAAAVPIARGEQELRARVSIRWALER